MSGGIRVVAIYAKALLRMGHVVRLVSPPPQTIPLHRKARSWLAGRGWPSDRPPQSHLDGSGLDHRVLDRWRPVTDRDIPDGDVVIATWWETAEWVGALAASKGAKVYFVQHHEVFPYLPIERCHATYRLPMHKIVVARWLKQVMAAEYGDIHVDVVPNSVDRDQFFAPARSKQGVPTVGVPYYTATFKGLDVSLAALRLVRERVPNLRVIAFGSERPTSGLPLPAGVEFFLSPAQDEIRNLYARCDVWLTASRSEGFNLPAMEAMACRTPVVATRTGWPEEAVQTGRNGVLVDVDDVQGLAAGVEWVLSRSESEWRELSENAHATASVGSWEESAKLFESALLRARKRHAESLGKLPYS
jgi:glycosyltransferase involved in cell wall biosynthesis